MPPRQQVAALGLLLLLAATWWSFAPCLSGGFVNWDDPYNFLDNYAFRGLGWNELHWALTARRLGVYQPLAWLLFSGEYAFGGLQPPLYHATSLLLHMLNSALLWLLLLKFQSSEPEPELAQETLPELAQETRPDWWRWYRQASVATALAALFALHPLRVEAVAWVSCQPYLLCSLLALLASWCYLAGTTPPSTPQTPSHRRIWLAACFAFFCSACLAKAAAAFLPLLFFACSKLHQRRGAKSLMPGLFLGAATVFSALTLGVATWARAEIHQSPQAYTADWLTRLVQAAYALSLQLRHTFWPLDLSPYYPPLTIDPQAPLDAVSLPVVVSVLLIAGALLAYRRYPLLALTCGVWVAVLAPNLGLKPISTSVAGDRYTYLAAAVLSLLFGLGCPPIKASGPPRQSRWMQAVLFTCLPVLVIIAFSPLTRAQSKIWHGSVELWERALAVSGNGPETEDIHNNLGLAYSEAGDFTAASRELRRATELKPLYALGYTNLGIVQTRQTRYSEARVSFQTALKLDPLNADALTGAAAMAFTFGDLETALRDATQALAQRPADPVTLSLLAQIKAAAGDYPAAAAAVLAALQLRPDDATALNTLGAIYSLRGDKQAAAREYSKALAIDPRFFEAQLNLADAMFALGEHAAAAAYYRQALILRPGDIKALTGLKAAENSP